MADRKALKAARPATGRTDHTGRRAVAGGEAGATIPVWLPPVAYALVVVLLFHEFFFRGGLLLGEDTYALSYFARDFYTTYVHEQGRFPLWNPLIFGGMPFVEGMHGDIFYPPSLALFFLEPRTFWGWKMVLHIYAAGLFTYLWLRGIGLSRGPAFFGGLVYMMGADLVSLIAPGGDGKLFVSALAPLMFWLTERCVRGRRFADFALFSLGLALVVFTSHMQLAYFTVWGVSLYFLFRLWQVWRAGRSGTTSARMLLLYTMAGVLGVAAAAVQFLPPLGYLREHSQRAGRTLEADAESAYLYSSQYSLHAEEVVSLAVPEFAGDNIQTETRDRNRYWGRNPFKINSEYAGLVPLLLVPLLFVRRRRPETWFFTGLAVLAVLYGLGASTPFFRLFYLIPGVNLFRAPSLIIFLYGLSVATLGALALQRMLEWSASTDDRDAGGRTLWIVAAAFLVLAIAQSGEVITSMWRSAAPPQGDHVNALAANLPYIRTGFWIAFALAAAVAFAWEALRRGWIGRREIVIGLAVLAALDLYRVDRPFIRNAVLLGEYSMRTNSALFEPDETIRFLQNAARQEVFRVYDLGNIPELGVPPRYSGNDLAAHGIEQLTGHHGNEPGRYDALMGVDDSAPNVRASQFRLLELANVAYVVSPGRIEHPDFQEVHASSDAVVYRYLPALPRAYLVGNVEIVPDSQAILRLLGGEFPMHTTALLAEPLPAGIEIAADPQGEVTWSEREADHYTLRVSTDRPALLVISDNHYPAWRAEVDDASAPLLRANFTFRAVPVPAGEHDVRLEFRNPTLRASAAFSIVVIIVLGGVALTGLWRRGEGDPA